MAYNTGNPPGSTSPKDLIDNAEDLDQLMTGGAVSVPNRLGVPLKSWKGMEGEHNASQANRQSEFNATQIQKQAAFDASQSMREDVFDQYLEGSGWTSLGNYASGISIVSHSQTVEYGGQPYSLKPSVPASISAPYITSGNWATESVNFKLVGDNSLRQAMASYLDPLEGSSLLGHNVGSLDGGGRMVSDWIRSQAVSVYQFRHLVSPLPNALDPSTWDWSPAFEAAAATKRPVSYPRQPGGFILGDVPWPVGTITIGPSTPRYVTSSLASAQNLSALQVKAGSTRLFVAPVGVSFVEYTFRDCAFYGYNKTGAPIGSPLKLNMVKFVNCGSYNFFKGFGVDGNYLATATMLDCHAAGNIRGFADLVDSKVIGGFANTNTIGAYQGTGANDTEFLGFKNEFNTEEGYLFFGSQSCAVNGGIIDRNGKAGIRAVDSEVRINGPRLKRNGHANIGTVESAHIYTEGATSILSIVNATTATGTNDDGSGVRSPTYAISEGSGSPKVSWFGGDARGSVVQSRLGGAGETEYRGVRGITDRCNFGYNRVINGAYSVYRFDQGVFLAVGATDTVNMQMPPIQMNSRQARKLQITLRTSSAVTSYGRFEVMFSRNSASVSVSWAIPEFVNPANTVAMDATGSVQLTFANFSADGSTFDVTVKNNHASNTYTYTIELL